MQARGERQTWSRICAQVQVCQMPRSLWRMAGRSPNERALCNSSFGKVSAGARRLLATASSQGHAAATPRALSFPSPPFPLGRSVPSIRMDRREPVKSRL
jgi:hypothetical protein